MCFRDSVTRIAGKVGRAGGVHAASGGAGHRKSRAGQISLHEDIVCARENKGAKRTGSWTLHAQEDGGTGVGC